MHRAGGDFYQVARCVSPDDQAILGRVRAFAEETVAPIINHYWAVPSFRSSCSATTARSELPARPTTDTVAWAEARSGMA